MLAFLGRLISTLVYCFIGLWLAFPLSYFFQDSVYSEMSLSDYLAGGSSSILIGAQFGAYETYRWTVLWTVIVVVVLGKLIEKRLLRSRKEYK
ncbi:MAG: hypothetical protein CSA45_05080 [Gammaproteobacteria bacterium]|nr:MAG: hypothetical protein CSA45_05080 [Gammaproteobacteria bacterium]